MIIDSFIFYNEIDLLEARLYELFDVVDYFIIVEGTKTHTGLDKNLYFKENINKFEKYLSKIIHLIANDFPITNNAWDREKYQRDYIDIGFKSLNLSADDIVMISDVDEIISSDLIKKIKSHEIDILDDNIYSLEMILYYYSLEYSTHRKWQHPKLLKYSKYLHYNSPDSIRYVNPNSIIVDAGWHISYYGDDNFIIKKLESYSETQTNIPKFKDKNFLNECISNGKLFFNDENLIKIPIKNNKNLPKFFLNKK